MSFSKLLEELLKEHQAYQQAIQVLTKENEALKRALQEQRSVSSSVRASSSVVVHHQHLAMLTPEKINALIQEIDECLAYFQESSHGNVCDKN